MTGSPATGASAPPSVRPTPRRVVLVSTYDLGRQPFGLASPAAWLAVEGHRVRTLDLAIDAPDAAALAEADVIAFHVPMHTAARLTSRLLPWVRSLNPCARVAVYGLYAPVNAAWFRELGATAAIGGEFEAALAAFVRGEDGGASVTLERLAFLVPDRRDLPPLTAYARLRMPDGSERVAGATEASRGCKHQCRHCPVVPVYGGRFRIVPIDVVLADIDALVAAGAEHVTFGDPDFWNGIGHALPLVRRLHARHPRLTYDVTIKIEHLLRHAEHVRELRDTGCLFVTSAIESLDDAVLARLDKQHTRKDFEAAVSLLREHELPLSPTFVAFTPWTTRAGYTELLDTLAELDLVEHVAPIQLAIRLLVPAGSRLLELEEVRRLCGAFDTQALVHPWRHPDPEMDALQHEVFARVTAGVAAGRGRPAIFEDVAAMVANASSVIAAGARPTPGDGRPRRHAPAAASFRRAPVPYMTEPWYC